jgi:hypothetical protein
MKQQLLRGGIHWRTRFDNQNAKPEPDSTWSYLQPVALVSELDQLPQKVPMDFEVLLVKLKGVQTTLPPRAAIPQAWRCLPLVGLGAPS